MVASHSSVLLGMALPSVVSTTAVKFTITGTFLGASGSDPL